MFKKQDPWQSGIKLVSKFLGFDNDQPKNYQNQNVPYGGTGLLNIRGSNQIPVISKSQKKNLKLKQKWKKLMKMPPYKCRKQIIQLLREGSTIEDQTWMWLMKNTQKVTSNLYNIKRDKLHSIIYKKNLQNWNDDALNDPNIQIQDFTQYPEFKLSEMEVLNQGKKRKFSITKGSTLMKNTSTNQVAMTGRMSLNSQGSTFSSQTHNSYNQHHLWQRQSNNSNNSYGSPMQKNQFTFTNNSMKTSYNSQSLSAPRTNTLNNNNSYNNNCYNSPQILSSEQSELSRQLLILPGLINHGGLTDIIGSFLLQRQDISYSITLFNMAASFYFYTGSNQIKQIIFNMKFRTFILLNNVATSQVYIQYLSKDPMNIESMLQYIVSSIYKNCSSSVFLKRFRLQNFIENWLYSFFYCICENGSQTKEKMFGYLLLQSFSLDSITKVCQSIINSLARIINQGRDDKIYQCLQNPKLYIEQQTFTNYLLHEQKN